MKLFKEIWVNSFSKGKWIPFVIIISAGVFASIYVKHMTRNSRILLFSKQINGVIHKVEYNYQHTVIVTFDSRPLNLGAFNVKIRDSIAVGDSLWKGAGVDTLYHYKMDESGEYELYDTHSSGVGKYWK